MVWSSSVPRSVRFSLPLICCIVILLPVSLKLKYGGRHLQLKREKFIASRWIVLTTIALPTNDVMKLAQTEGWQVLVVGDRKTPVNWKYPGVIFLSIRDQEQLNYSILDVLKYDSYTRKNIGYLYAIQHGATVIYETDDDNHPTDRFKSFIFTQEEMMLQTTGSRKLFNPYAHFGQDTIWPRGYPLEDIGEPNTYAYSKFSIKRPAIQQGLVDGDPDVDAIFRLTRKNARANINVTFDHKAPPIVLAPHTYCPYNSQNTIIHHEAFWSLVLPSTVAMRVTDIWRGYWAQRLLWLIDGRVAFVPPNAMQKRNAHSYLADFKQEDDLYRKAGSLVRLLDDWECTGNTLVHCINDLTAHMSDHNMWGSADKTLIAAWLGDLEKVGYQFPPLSEKDTNQHETIPYEFKTEQQRTVFPNTPLLKNQC